MRWVGHCKTLTMRHFERWSSCTLTSSRPRTRLSRRFTSTRRSSYRWWDSRHWRSTPPACPCLRSKRLRVSMKMLRPYVDLIQQLVSHGEISRLRLGQQQMNRSKHNLGRQCCVQGGSFLEWRMTNTVFTGNEDHGGRHMIRNAHRVMCRTRRHTHE